MEKPPQLPQALAGKLALLFSVHFIPCICLILLIFALILQNFALLAYLTGWSRPGWATDIGPRFARGNPEGRAVCEVDIEQETIAA
jgi:hypothetical protein